MKIEQLDLNHPFFADPPEDERAVILIEHADGKIERIVPAYRNKEVHGADNARAVLERCKTPARLKDSVAKEIDEIELPDLLTTDRIPGILKINDAIEKADSLIGIYALYFNQRYVSACVSLIKFNQFLDCLKIPTEAIKSSPPQTP